MASGTTINWSELMGFDLAIGIILAFLCARRATQYGRNAWAWGPAGFFFGPIPYLALILSTMNQAKAAAAALRSPPAVCDAPPAMAPPAPLQDSRLDGWYFVNAAREPIGPLAIQELIDRLQQSENCGSVLVWHPDMADWTAAAHAPLVSERLTQTESSS